MGILIKKDNLYYDASYDSYNIETNTFNSIGNEDSDIKSLLSNSTLEVEDLLKPIIMMAEDGITENVGPTMTSNTTPSPYIVTASSQYDTSYAPWQVFTKNNSTYEPWITTRWVTTGWIQIFLGEPLEINAFSITSRNATPYYGPKAFTFEGSDDGVSYKILKTVTNETWNLNQTKEYILDSMVNYKYYKLNVTESTGDEYIAIDNIDLLRKDVLGILSPLDQFDSFQIVKSNKDDIIVNGSKSNKEMIVSKVKLKSDVINILNYVKVSTTGSVKMVMSIDDGITWNKIEDGNLTSISVTIPNKQYSELTEAEILEWNSSMDIIETNGFTSDVLDTLDWTLLTINGLRFAFVLSRENYSDEVLINPPVISFDSKGHLKKMKKSEYDILLYDYSLKIQSLIDNPIIKVNTLLRETDRDVIIDPRTTLGTPVITMVNNDGEITLTWNAVEHADYYKVYLDGINIADSSELTSTFTIETKTGIHPMCIRAYSNLTNEYRPSAFSNVEFIDFSGYLATSQNEYVAVRIGGKLYKYKVKNTV